MRIIVLFVLLALSTVSTAKPMHKDVELKQLTTLLLNF